MCGWNEVNRKPDKGCMGTRGTRSRQDRKQLEAKTNCPPARPTPSAFGPGCLLWVQPFCFSLTLTFSPSSELATTFRSTPFKNSTTVYDQKEPSVTDFSSQVVVVVVILPLIDVLFMKIRIKIAYLIKFHCPSDLWNRQRRRHLLIFGLIWQYEWA